MNPFQMLRDKTISRTIFTIVLGLCLFLTACGKKAEETSTEDLTGCSSEHATTAAEETLSSSAAASLEERVETEEASSEASASKTNPAATEKAPGEGPQDVIETEPETKASQADKTPTSQAQAGSSAPETSVVPETSTAEKAETVPVFTSPVKEPIELPTRIY